MLAKFIVLFFSLFVFLHAEFEQKGFETNYLDELKTNTIPEKTRNLIDSDQMLQMAINFLTSKDFMVSKEIGASDAHKQSNETKTIYIPNIHKAYEQLLKSIEKNNNPFSSYIAMHLIKTAYGKKQKLQDFAKFSKMNYEHGLCSGYIDYGEVLERGIFQKADKPKAIKVYEEGLLKCNEDWYGALMSGRLAALRK